MRDAVVAMFGLMLFDDVISFGASISEALARLEEVLCRLSDFGLQLKANKCTFMQTEVAFLGHIVGQTGLACDPEKISAVCNWQCTELSEGSTPVRRFYRLLSPVRVGLCGLVGASGDFDSEGGSFRLDRPAGGV